MRKFKIYLDTTIPSYVFNDHVPDKQMAAKRLFEHIGNQRFEGYISATVVGEILETKDQTLKERIVSVVKDLKVLEVTPECMTLAKGVDQKKYHSEGKYRRCHPHRLRQYI